jgi:hypothetical protein
MRRSPQSPSSARGLPCFSIVPRCRCPARPCLMLRESSAGIAHFAPPPRLTVVRPSASLAATPQSLTSVSPPANRGRPHRRLPLAAGRRQLREARPPGWLATPGRRDSIRPENDTADRARLLRCAGRVPGPVIPRLLPPISAVPNQTGPLPPAPCGPILLPPCCHKVKGPTAISGNRASDAKIHCPAAVFSGSRVTA